MDDANNNITLWELPGGWKWVSLIEVLHSMETGSRPTGGAQGLTSGVPSISAEHMTPFGTFDFSELRYVPTDFYVQMKQGKIQTNDILVVKDGATTGKTVLVDETFPFMDAAVNEHVFLCRPNTSLILPRFLFYWLWSESGQLAIRSCFQGAAIGGINRSFANAVSVPLPPLPEQNRIVSILHEQMSAIEKLREAAKTQLGAVKALPTAYIHESLRTCTHWYSLHQCVEEVTKGVGSSWRKYPLIGVSRNGVAPAKESVGKTPERYKLVDKNMIFYNCSRSL